MNENKNLLLKASQRDEKALEEIVNKYNSLVYNICIRMLNNAADAHDAAQATFIIFWEKCVTMSPDAVLSVWFYWTATYVSKRSLYDAGMRKSSEKKAVMLNNWKNPEDSQDWTKVRAYLDAAINGIPAKYQDVLILHYFGKQTLASVARTLDIPQGTAASRLSRGIEYLRGKLKKRDIVITIALLAMFLKEKTCEAAVPESLNRVSRITKAVSERMTSKAAVLAKSVMKTMMWSKIKRYIAVSGFVILAAGVGFFVIKGAGSGDKSNAERSAKTSHTGVFKPFQDTGVGSRQNGGIPDNTDMIDSESKRNNAPGNVIHSDRDPDIPVLIQKMKENLVGHWSFDEGEGQEVQDASGNEISGIIHGAKWGEGVSGKALHFDGVDDYVEISHSDMFLLDNGTVAFWFKTDQPGVAISGLWSKDSNRLGTGGHLIMHLNRESELDVRFQSVDKTYFVRYPGKFKQNTWYHFTFSFGNSSMRVYINGNGLVENSYKGGLGKTSGGKGNYEPIVIAASSSISNDLSATPVHNYFKGMIDDVRFYKCVLKKEEIKTLVETSISIEMHKKLVQPEIKDSFILIKEL